METRQATPSTTVVYSKPNCPSCVKAKALLQSKNIPYQESIIGKDIQVEPLKYREVLYPNPFQQTTGGLTC